MTDRATLIAQKNQVRRELEQTRRTLDHELAKEIPNRRQCRRLEHKLDQLMAREQALRLQIDRSR